MQTIPAPVFAARLGELRRSAFREFVAGLWEASGWETTGDGHVVVARRDGSEQRLLVRTPGRLDRFRSSTVDPSIDRIVTTGRLDDERERGDDHDVPVVDADDLRRRLLYGIDDRRAEKLCQTHLDVPLRAESWDSGHLGRPIPVIAVALLALLILGGTAVAFVSGVSMFGEEPAATTPVNTSQLDAEIDSSERDTAVHTSVGSPTETASGGTVYVGVRDTVRAIDATTGEPSWRFTGLTSDAGPLLVANGTVYVRSFGRLYAIDALTGAEKWRYNGTAGPVWYPPTVVDGTAYVGHGSRVLAIDARTGATEWTFTEPAAGRSSITTPTVRNGTVYAASWNGTLYAIDAATGDPEWSVHDADATYRWLQVVRATQGGENGTAGNATAILAGENAMYAVDTETRERTWTFSTDWSVSPPTVVQEYDANASQWGEATVYVSNYRAEVYALDARTGEIEWETSVPGATYTSEPAVDRVSSRQGTAAGQNRTVYVSTGDFLNESTSWGRVLAVDSVTGDVSWRFNHTEGWTSTVSVADGTVYFRTETGTTYALEAATGDVAWRRNNSGSGTGPPPTVVRDPVDGNSIDTRTLLGTAGHHDWLDTDPAGRTAERPPEFRIVNHTRTKTVGAGERGILEATIVNAGDRGASRSVYWDVGWETDAGALVDRELSLGGGLTRTARLSFVAPDEPGEYEYTVDFGPDSRTGTVTVVDVSGYEVQSTDDPSRVRQGDGVEILATVRNPNDVAGTTNVSLAVDGTVVDRTRRTVGGNDSVTVTFSFEIDDDAAPGAYNYTVQAGTDARSGTLEVLSFGDQGRDAGPIVWIVGVVTALVVGLAVGWRLFPEELAGVVAQRSR